MGDEVWDDIRDGFIRARYYLDNEREGPGDPNYRSGSKIADDWLKAHDAQVASEAAEKALRDAASECPTRLRGGGLNYVENIPGWLIARADRLAHEGGE
jgi:hypothetical protein